MPLDGRWFHCAVEFRADPRVGMVMGLGAPTLARVLLGLLGSEFSGNSY
jgi:hypothetical protein